MPNLTAKQMECLGAAKPDGHLWRVDSRHAGFRGLPTKGLAHGASSAQRRPGFTGVLTAAGERERERLTATTGTTA